MNKKTILTSYEVAEMKNIYSIIELNHFSRFKAAEMRNICRNEIIEWTTGAEHRNI